MSLAVSFAVVQGGGNAAANWRMLFLVRIRLIYLWKRQNRWRPFQEISVVIQIPPKIHTVRLNKKLFCAVKALGLINLTNISVSITHFKISIILIIMIYCTNILLVILWLEFWLRIPSSYYVNIQNLGHSNIWLLASHPGKHTLRLSPTPAWQQA